MKNHAVRNVVIVSLLVLTSSAALQAADMLAIKVIDKATGKPMPDVKLSYSTFPGETTATISLGEKGEAFLSWAGVDKYRLLFQFNIDGQPYEIHSVISAADANAGTLTLEIPTAQYKKTLVVTPTDSATGKPVANARISVTFILTGANIWRTQKMDTSAKGESVLRWAGEGKYKIYCTTINGRPLINHRLERELTEADWKAGRVTWKIDVPRLSARVKVFILSKGKKTPAPDGMILRFEHEILRKSGTHTYDFRGKCKNGKTTLYGLKVGSKNTLLPARIYRGEKAGWYVAIDAKTWIFKGKVLDFTVTFIPRSEYRGELAIKVVGEKGTPISDATVTLSGNAKKIKGKTDANGVAVFKNLEADGYSCEIKKEGYHPAYHSRMRLPGSEGATVTLQKQYALDVTVVDRNGKPADIGPCFALGLTGKKHEREARTTDKGKTCIERLYRGKYLILAFASDKGEKEHLNLNWLGERAGAIVEIPTDKSVKLVLRQPHIVNLQIITEKEKVLYPRLIFISPDQKDVLPKVEVTPQNTKVSLFKGIYLVFYKGDSKGWVLLGERTVTGSGTMKFDLNDPALKKAPRFSGQGMVVHLLPKEHRPKTKPPSTMPAHATSRPAR